MSNTCNIYYNSLNRKWLFFKVNENGEESLLNPINHKGPIERGESLSFEHLEDIKGLLNINPQVPMDAKIYVNDENIKSYIESWPKQDSIRIEILYGDWIHEKCESVERLLKPYFPKINLCKQIGECNDENTIKCFEVAISQIKFVVENIDNKTNELQNAIDEFDKNIKDISDRQEYKDVLIRNIDQIVSLLDYDDDTKSECIRNIECRFDRETSAYFANNISISGKIKPIYDDVRWLPVTDFSNPTLKFLREYFKNISLVTRTTTTTVVSTSIASIYGGGIIAGAGVIWYWYIYYLIKKHNKPSELKSELEEKEMSALKSSWDKSQRQIVELIEKRRTDLLTLLTSDTQYDAQFLSQKLDEANASIQNYK